MMQGGKGGASVPLTILVEFNNFGLKFCIYWKIYLYISVMSEYNKLSFLESWTYKFKILTPSLRVGEALDGRRRIICSSVG